MRKDHTNGTIWDRVSRDQKLWESVNDDAYIGI